MAKHFEHTTLSLFTQRNYDICINKWIEYLKKSIVKILKTPELSFKQLKALPQIKSSHHVYKQYVNAIVSYMKYHRFGSLTDSQHEIIQDKWRTFMIENDVVNKEHYKDNTPSERQAPKKLNWADVLKVRDSLPDGIPKLLLSMYTYIEPERADYFELELIRTDEKPTSSNYINLTEKKLILTDFKTKKTYEKLELTVPEELMRQILLSLTETPRQYLFLNRFKKPFERPQFSNYANRTLTEIFKSIVPSTNLTCLRHSYVSSLDFTKTIRELDAVAKRMGHDVMTHKKYAWIEPS